MKLQITLYQDEDGIWIVECPEIPGCVSQGATRQEAIQAIQEAIAACIEVRAEKEMPLTIMSDRSRLHDESMLQEQATTVFFQKIGNYFSL